MMTWMYSVERSSKAYSVTLIAMRGLKQSVEM